ncbi:hypothetical protein BN12_280015 [Nostocoides japonicum T1-X7]|uniref:Uncharacterized protein n=1 Tax=Nostocoides japonicum T1-X7 TaxID=1194083 RepID=A0A077M2B4_9MICO|nr:hypothetical protein BN12_280015 [Tetrasphaera japonica T1-X7]
MYSRPAPLRRDYCNIASRPHAAQESWFALRWSKKALSLARGPACQCAGWQRLRTAPCFIGAAPSGRRTTLTHAGESEVPLHGYVLGACEPTLELNQLLHLESLGQFHTAVALQLPALGGAGLSLPLMETRQALVFA